MSGMFLAATMLKGYNPPAPPAPFHVTMAWTGAVPVNVSSASGSTSGSNRFVHTVSGGSGSTASDSINVNYNPSGKLGLTTVGTGLGVSWSGLAVGEAVQIGVGYQATDTAGATSSASDTAVIRRTS